jgi:phosphoribosylformylglycinamidine synthase
MLMVVKRGREPEVEAIFAKWDLHAANIGVVTDDGLMRVKDRGAVVAEIPNTALVDEAPVYDRPTERPRYLDAVRSLDFASLAAAPPPVGSFLTLLSSPAIASKRWVYRQYDHMVRTNTLVLAGMGAGVVRVKGTSRALAVAIDGNGRYSYLDPRRGAMLAVAESARNVACAGGEPIGATNCLNFGNPQRPEIMWQLVESIEGIAEACRALDIPITGGNVSLYNETDGEAIYPTPTIGVLGVIEDGRRALARTFKAEGDAVVLLGDSFRELGGSEYLKVAHGIVGGLPPAIDLDRERALIRLLTAAISRGLLESAHDPSDGGLAVALAECAFDTGGIGAAVDVPAARAIDEQDAPVVPSTLFGESASRAVVSVAESRLAALLELASRHGVPAVPIGWTGGERIRIAVDGEPILDCALAEAELRWSTALETHFGRHDRGRAA